MSARRRFRRGCRDSDIIIVRFFYADRKQDDLSCGHIELDVFACASAVRILGAATADYLVMVYDR
jgi:hypothetical protein